MGKSEDNAQQNTNGIQKTEANGITNSNDAQRVIFEWKTQTSIWATPKEKKKNDWREVTKAKMNWKQSKR